ncbi:NAD(P)/FAD-dependent oxidoreductase, partial [Bradyrhizobium sp. 2TAF24]|uniref:NAD(P)/FAD-dependent oxidoreductase n=1 Tax=Bradyrhizobium sp. 2TAF24 TaxID=3233011 RepID=UPI003F8FB0CE
MTRENDVGDNAPPAEPARPRLTFDLDVDVCVVGAGLAGLTAARELARQGMSVAVLEARRVGWNASGHMLGTVMPGFTTPIADLIARVGFDDARELWGLAQQGADYVRDAVAAGAVPAIEAEGALEVSTVDSGEQLISRLQTLGEDFGVEVEGWQADRVREVLRTARYFHAIHFPSAFAIDGRRYVHGLAMLAEQAGVCIFEETAVVELDLAGVRKRIATPEARLRAGQVVLAGSVHLGAPHQRLADTLLPVWRHAAVTAPLGERLREVMAYAGSVGDADGLTHYRIVDGDRLLWLGPESTWRGDPAAAPRRISRRVSWAIARQIRTLYPALGPVEIAETFGGVIGQTVHGMPQIGELSPGVWVASGFGRQGLNTSAMAAQVITRGILHSDDRWRLFAPFELVWAGGRMGRFAGQAVITWSRGQASAAGALARYRERARVRASLREEREAASRAAA